MNTSLMACPYKAAMSIIRVIFWSFAHFPSFAYSSFSSAQVNSSFCLNLKSTVENTAMVAAGMISKGTKFEVAQVEGEMIAAVNTAVLPSASLLSDVISAKFCRKRLAPGNGFEPSLHLIGVHRFIDPTAMQRAFLPS